MTITRVFLALSIAVGLANLYVLIDAESFMRPALGEARYLWISLVYIAGMYLISMEIARFGGRFLGRKILGRR